MQDKLKFGKSNLVFLVSELIKDQRAFTPDPDDPDPSPWPWRHVLNSALTRVQLSIAGNSNPFARVALNPQPLPPRLHFAMVLAQELVERATMMHEVNDGVNQNGEQRGIIIVGGYINKFVDEICPTPPVIKFPKRHWPLPPEPDPHPDWTGLELAVIGTHFLNEARFAGNKDIQHIFNAAGEKLLEVATSRMY